jgi:hypothetical protein
MHCSSSVPGGEERAERAEPRARPVRGPRGRAADPAEVNARQVQDDGRAALIVDGVVTGRLFSAGLALETALGLMDGDPAAAKVREALSELDLAIADLRTVLLDHRQPDPPSGGRPG